MKIAVVPNLTKEAAQTCTDEVLSILGRCGCETVLKTDLFTAHGIYQERVDSSPSAGTAPSSTPPSWPPPWASPFWA